MPTTYTEGRVIVHAGAVPTPEELAGTAQAPSPAPDPTSEPVIEPMPPETPPVPEPVKAPVKSPRVGTPRLPVAKPAKAKKKGK